MSSILPRRFCASADVSARARCSVRTLLAVVSTASFSAFFLCSSVSLLAFSSVVYRFSSYVDLKLNFNLFTSNWSNGTPSGVIELVAQLVLVLELVPNNASTSATATTGADISASAANASAVAGVSTGASAGASWC